MPNREYITVDRDRFSYTRKHYNAKDELVLWECFDSETDHLFLVMHYYYDEQGRKIRETADVDNERERSHTETLIRYEDEVMICDSITHYAFSGYGLRDERTVEHFSGTSSFREVYDLETGELKCVEDFDPAESLYREITYRPDGSVDVDYDDDII